MIRECSILGLSDLNVLRDICDEQKLQNNLNNKIEELRKQRKKIKLKPEESWFYFDMCASTCDDDCTGTTVLSCFTITLNKGHPYFDEQK